MNPHHYQHRDRSIPATVYSLKPEPAFIRKRPTRSISVYFILFLILIAGLMGSHAQNTCGRLGVPTITAATPSIVSSTAANVAVSWQNVGATKYTLTYKPTGGSSTQVCSGTATACTINNLQLGVTYTVQVEARRNCQLAPGEPDVDITTSTITLTLPPPAPTGLSATTVTPVSFVASWASTPGAASYRIDVSASSAFTTFLVNNATVNATSTTISGTTSGTTYYYRVRAVNTGGTSPNSATFTVSAVAPTAPASITASGVASTQFTINWTSSTGATSYRLDVSTSSSFTTGMVISDETETTTTKTVTAIQPNTTYYARVRAVNPAGVSGNSPTLTQTTPPAVPVNLIATNITTTSFTAGWTASAGATLYQVDVSSIPTFTTLERSSITTVAPSINITGLVTGTTYYFRVRALSGSLSSGNSAAGTAQLLPVKPIVTGTPDVTTTSFTVSWSLTGATDEFAIDLSENENFESVTTFAHLPAASRSYTFSALASGRLYYARIRAVNLIAGASENSDAAVEATLLPTPTLTDATNVETNFFTANWSTVPGANVYWFDASTDPSFTTLLDGYSSLGISANHISVAGLTLNTQYYYRVRASNSVSLSDYAAPASVQTKSGDRIGDRGDQEGAFKVSVIPPSPEAAALAKYADIPVSLYSGTPNISIPLYEIKERGLTLPLSLTYHASGHKVGTIAPRTGLGWTLNAGGAVTRSVRGLPDEHPRGFLQLIKDYDNIGKILDLDPNLQYLLYNDLADGCRDGEPDVFYYNFPGYSGQFMFDWDGQIKVLTGNSVKIEPIGLSTTPTTGDYIDGWKITVDDGTIFTFNIVETTGVLETYDGGPVCSYLDELQKGDMPQTWYVSEMRSADQQSAIFFQYGDYRQQNEFWASESMMHTISLSPAKLTRQKQKVNIFGKNLQRITVSSGQTIVAFNDAARARKDVSSNLTDTTVHDNFALGQIHITNANSRVLKHWDLEYNYSTNRLTLARMTERIGTTALPPHEFKYQGTLPDPLSFAQDHWGFTNGNSAQTMIPATTAFRVGDPRYNAIHLDGANREPSRDGALKGLLTEISYPTGGKDVLEYEVHQYGFEQSQELYQKITTTDGVGISLPNEPYVTGHVQQASETFTLQAPTTVGFASFAGFGYKGPAGGFYSGKADLLDSNGNTVFSQFLTKGADDTRTRIDSLFLNAGTYTLTVSIVIPPIYEGSGVNSIASEINWKVDTGERRPLFKTGGGARIAKITRVYGNNNPDKVTVYNYTLTEDGKTKSSGSLLESGYVYETWLQIDVSTDGYTMDLEDRFARFSQNRIALGTTQGSHVGYSQVTVLQGKHGENGATVYNFNSPREIGDWASRSIPFPPAQSFDYLRGLTLRQTAYGAGHIGTDTVHRVKNTYKSFDHSIPGIKIGWNVLGARLRGAAFLEMYAVGNYANQTGYTRLVKTSEKNFDHSAGAAPALEQTTTYEYNETTHKQLVKTSTVNSKNETMVSAIRYPLDYGSIGGSIGTLQSLHMDNVPVEILTWKQDTGSGGFLLSGVKTDFKTGASGIVPAIKYTTRITNPVSATDPFTAAQPLYSKRLVLDVYDAFNNIREATPASGIKTAFQWGYNGTLPTAKADNAAANQIFFESFEEDGTAVTTGKHTGIKSKPINGTYTVPAASRPAVAGDYMLTYWAQTSGGVWTYQEKTIMGYTPGVAIVTDTVTGLIDDIRVYPVGAQMTTYTYEPALGITSVTDPANMSVFYEYDELNRLAYVRDLNGNIVQGYQYQYKIEAPYEVQE